MFFRVSTLENFHSFFVLHRLKEFPYKPKRPERRGLVLGGSAVLAFGQGVLEAKDGVKMTTKIHWRWRSGIVLSAIAIGCGGGTAVEKASQPKPTANQSLAAIAEEVTQESNDEPTVVIPTSAVSPAKKKPVEDDEPDAKMALPDKDTSEWFILKITQLKLRPLGDPDVTSDQTLQRQAELRRERNEQLVELATEAIARTHKDSSKERVFDLAVHHLLEAELQLALAGDREHIDALYEHASSLYARNSKSKSAVEAGQTLIALARTNAQRFGQKDRQSLEEFARLARQFAKNFPQEERQSIPTLLAAGQSCEFHGLNTEAAQCYTAIRDQFPENPAASRVTPMLRRLSLKGKPLQLAGPAVGGGFLNAEEFIGKPLLVIFWNTQTQPFVRELSTLQGLLNQIDSDRLNVVSVNFDDDDNDSAVQTFLETNGLKWPTIFHAEEGQRGWNNPIAAYYGIQSVPMYWVVNSKGNVVKMGGRGREI